MLSKDKYKIFFSKRKKYRENPVLFFNEILTFYPDEWQKKAAMDLAKSPKVSIRSGQGVGKTGLEAAILLWFLFSFSFSRIVATAPTRQQLNDILWSEAAKWMNKNPVLKELFKWTKTKIYVVSQEERWFAVAKTATKAENIQGFHEKNMLFIVDEASGVSDSIMEAILGTLSGENNKLLMCGNPTRKTGVFYDSHNNDRDLYKCYKVSSLDSKRTNKENINSIIKKYGENSNVVRVRVYGEFPIDEDDIFITTEEVHRGMNLESEIDLIQTIDIGVDVARFGDDNSVIAVKINNTILPLKVFHGYATTETAKYSVSIARQLRDKYKFQNKIYLKIDDTGVGGGVTDYIKEIKNTEKLDWLKVVPVNFGISVNHPYYYDLNTVLWGNVKDMLDEERLSIPNDTDLEGELTNRKKGFSQNGKIKIESKKEMKSRGLVSPDRGDAVALAAWHIQEPVKKARKNGDRR